MVVRFRVYVGPRVYPHEHKYSTSWAQWRVGATEADVGVGLSTRLREGVSAGHFSVLSLDDQPAPVGFGAKGGAWVGSNSPGQSWEWIAYGQRGHRQLQQLMRAASPSAHSAGAAVAMWRHLVDNDGQMTVTWGLDSAGLMRTWELGLSGVSVPPEVRSDHIVAVFTSERDDSDWTPYRLRHLGASTEATGLWQVKGDTWTLRVVDMLSFFGANEVPAVRTGTLNVAKHGQASGSTPLAAAHKERHSGDVVGNSPTFVAGNAIDGDPATCWIGDYIMGGSNDPSDGVNVQALDMGNYLVTQLYINPPSGQAPGYRWLEITSINGSIGDIDIKIVDAAGNEWQEHNTELNGAETFDHFILAEDATRFAEENPSSRAKSVQEPTNPIFNVLTPEGGAIAIRGPGGIWHSVLRWGNNTDVPSEWGRDWNGPTVAAPQEGETIRFQYDPATPDAGNHRNWWKVDRLGSPGYNLDEDDEQFWAVNLPRMELTVAESGAWSPGQTLPLQDASETLSTAGLPASGSVRLGTLGATATYSSKSKAGLVVTSPVSATAGDTVEVLSGGVSTDALAIDQIQVMHRVGGTTLRHFDLLTSRLQQPRTPGTAGWSNDWDAIAQIRDNTSDAVTINSSGFWRATHVLVRIFQMNNAPTRARIHEVRSRLHTGGGLYAADAWQPPQGALHLISGFLQRSGLPPGAIQVVGNGFTIADNATSRSTMATLVRDLAEYAGCSIVVAGDSHVRLEADSFYSGLVGSPDHLFDRESASQVESTRTAGKVRQAITEYLLPDGTEGKARWPATPTWRGETAEEGPLLFAGAGAAQQRARRRYQAEAFPQRLVVTLAGGDWGVLPMDTAEVDWAHRYAPATAAHIRTVRVETVDQEIRNGELTTVATCQPFDWSDPQE